MYLYSCQNIGSLLTPHNGDLGIGPHEEKARIIGPAAHSIVAGAETAADDHREFWDLGIGHRVDELGAIFRDDAMLVFFADNEARDVLEKEQGNFFLSAKLNEMRAL